MSVTRKPLRMLRGRHRLRKDLLLLLLLLLSRFSRVRLCATPWTAAYQAPPSMGFSRQEYWSGMPLPSPQKRLEKIPYLHVRLILGTDTAYNN